MLGFSSMFFVSCASVDAKEHMEKQHSETFKYVGNTEQGYIFESKSKPGLYVEAKIDKDGNCFDNYELRRTEHDFSTKLSEVFDEDIISVNFVSMGNQDIGHFSVVCKLSWPFSKIEKKLYEDFPQYNKPETFFMVNAIKVEQNKTLKENKIKNNTLISVFGGD